MVVTANVLFPELLSGERAARSGSGGHVDGVCARDCARCCELMPAPREGTLICQECEEELEGGSGDESDQSVSASDDEHVGSDSQSEK